MVNRGSLGIESVISFMWVKSLHNNRKKMEHKASNYEKVGRQIQYHWLPLIYFGDKKKWWNWRHFMTKALQQSESRKSKKCMWEWWNWKNFQTKFFKWIKLVKKKLANVWCNDKRCAFTHLRCISGWEIKIQVLKSTLLEEL